MSAIDPEAAKPASAQAFEQSDRNPPVAEWDGNGGAIAAPASSASRVTKAGVPVSPNAGLKDYNAGDAADSVEDEAEREG